MIAPEQLEDRRPVWLAMSELFLDTELSRGDVAHMAEALAASPYELPELQAILFDEVAPVLGSNLVSPAGVWSGFDPAWLEQQIVRRARRPLRRPRWLGSGRLVRASWRQLESQILRVRASET